MYSIGCLCDYIIKQSTAIASQAPDYFFVATTKHPYAYKFANRSGNTVTSDRLHWASTRPHQATGEASIVIGHSPELKVHTAAVSCSTSL